jgi:hydroxyacylglutathione hydrolase
LPRIFNLEEYNPTLKDVHLIIGEGLCSNIYTIGKEHVTIVDPGVGNWANPVWPQLEEIGIQPENVEQVIITHAHHDHASGVYIILQRANPKIYVHTIDTRYIASSLGEKLVKVKEDDTIETELWPLKVIHTPGHTEGGMCLYNQENKILISGDTVFADGLYGAYFGEGGSLQSMINSLEKLTKLDVDILMPGHGSPVFKDAKEHISRAYQKASRPR